MNWIANAGQDGRARAELIRTNPFTAQTPLAASFGLLQMTYAVAVLEMDWSGDAHGIKHPTYLLDTDSNHSFRLGSLRLGSEKIAKHFRQLQRGSGVHISDFQTLLLLFNEAWQQYNPGKRSYGFSIASMVGQYLPVAASPPMMGAQ